MKVRSTVDLVNSSAHHYRSASSAGITIAKSWRSSQHNIATAAVLWISFALCQPASAELLRWKTNDYSVVLDGNTVLNGKLMGMEASNLGGGADNVEVQVYEWDPFYKVFWAGDDLLTTINLAKQPNVAKLYRNTADGELWSASGGSETDGEVYFYNPTTTTSSGFIYTTDTKASVTITNIKVEGEVTGKKGVFDAKLGGAVEQKTVRVARTLEAADPAVDVRVVFPTESFLATFYGGILEPDEEILPFNYDTVTSASLSDVSLTPPSGWDVYFQVNGLQTITGVVVDEITTYQDFLLSYSSTLNRDSRIPFYLLARIDDGASIRYYNPDPFGLQVIPEPASWALLALASCPWLLRRRRGRMS